MSQKKYAETIGVEVKRYAKWEEGRSQPDIDNIEAIAQSHNIPLDVLFNLDFARFTN